MQRRHFIHLFGMAAAGAALAGSASAQDRTRDRLRDPSQDLLRDQTRDRTRDQLRDEDIYGTQFMTQQERELYREQMRAARSADERERLELYHRNRMHARARNKGVVLPDDTRGMRGGMGQGGGMGGGMGGGGAGGGMGRQGG